MVGPRKSVLASRPRWRTFLLLGAAAVLAVGCTQAATEPVAESDETNPPSGAVAREPAAEPVEAAKPGEQLFARNCAACHGENGNGKGLAAQFLFPKPRDLRAGRFRLVSTSNGVPTLDDMIAVLRRGMPGSSMPPWSHLGDEQIRQLAEYVLGLRRQGAKEILLAALAESDDELPPEEVAEIVGECAGVNRCFGNGQCTAACLLEEIPDLSAACADCFGEITQCTLENCLFQCIDGADAPDCGPCRAENCGDAFEECSGLSEG